MSPSLKAPATWATAIIVTLLVMQAGRSAASPAPVDSLPPPPSERINYHIVSGAETLYAIAWRYELDVEALAAANGIAKPYPVHRGQKLTLDIARSRPPQASDTSVNAPPRAPEGKSAASAVPRSPPLQKLAQPRPPPRPLAVERPQIRVNPRATAPAPALGNATVGPPARAMVPPSASSRRGAWSWQWPVTGRFTRSYDANKAFTGIDIQSAAGRPVVAAAPGVVVYAGSGLRGYGQLIIIKHDDTYLSAYAHNRTLFVREGAIITPGQTISEVGGDSANSGRLYFEIRERGKPVDPLRLLPRL